MQRPTFRHFKPRPPATFLAALAVASLASCSGPKEDQAAAKVPQVVDGPYVWIGDGADATVSWILDDGRARTEQHVGQPTLRLKSPAGSELPEIVLDDVRSSPQVQPCEFDDVKRVFVLGDVHGEFEAAVELLQAAGIIDQQLRWAFGDGHAVFLGDVFDRGDKVTEMLWLIHQLEAQALGAGGAVHFVLGNHEAMVLRGDLRYVNEDAYLRRTCDALKRPYDQLYAADTVLGRWLRTKHAVVRINDTLLAHGGISPSLAATGLSITQINDRVRWALDVHHKANLDPELAKVLHRDGPLWYRGYFGQENGYEPASEEQLGGILDSFDVRRIVVAHTHVPRIATMFSGRVIAIDLPVEDGASPQGLMIEGDDLRVVLSDGSHAPLESLPVEAAAAASTP